MISDSIEIKKKKKIYFKNIIITNKGYYFNLKLFQSKKTMNVVKRKNVSCWTNKTFKWRSRLFSSASSADSVIHGGERIHRLSLITYRSQFWKETFHYFQYRFPEETCAVWSLRQEPRPYLKGLRFNHPFAFCNYHFTQRLKKKKLKVSEKKIIFEKNF